MSGRGEGPLVGKTIVLGVCGGIAAYKVAQVARDLAELGAKVQVVMTKAATRFVGEQTFATLTRRPVLKELFGAEGDVPHVELARGADLVVVAPATANILAKIRWGLADDLLSATLLTSTAPLLVVPAMHTEMWEAPATLDNVAALRERGVNFLGPAEGSLSSGDEGAGRMVEPDEIVGTVASLLGTEQDLQGRRALVTAGGTREAIDPVRYIGNHSSGLMGYLVAEELARRGAEVTLVTGPTSLAPPGGARVVRVDSSEEMLTAVREAAPGMDVIVKAAAVADFRPARPASKKIKKSGGPPSLELVPTTDILAELGVSTALKAGRVLVGFAAETEDRSEGLAGHARAKLEAKGADVVVANQVGGGDSGFGVGTSRAVVVTRDDVRDLGLVSKGEVAKVLGDVIASFLERP